MPGEDNFVAGEMSQTEELNVAFACLEGLAVELTSPDLSRVLIHALTRWEQVW